MSILKRIGFVSLATALVSFVCCMLNLAHFADESDTVTEWMARVLYNLATGVLSPALEISVLEFVCAQSPYNMRGLFTSFILPLLLITNAPGSNTSHYISHTACVGKEWCSIVVFSVQALASLVRFLLFCVLALWYTKRVRDDDYSPQQVVEEVYDRYLTAAAAYSKTYSTAN